MKASYIAIIISASLFCASCCGNARKAHNHDHSHGNCNHSPHGAASSQSTFKLAADSTSAVAASLDSTPKDAHYHDGELCTGHN